MFIVLIRAIIIYIIIIFCIRLMGKRQLGELQPSELVITILISNLATVSIEDIDIPIILSAIPIFTLVAFELFVSNVSLKKQKIRKLISGSPVVIIEYGEIIQSAMKKLRFSIDDLMEALREKDIFDINEVEYAIVETNGKVNVLQKFENQTITNKDMDIKNQKVDIPLVIVSDGEVINSSLTHYNLTENWLNKILEKNKCNIENVFLMTVDKKRKYYIVRKENKNV